MIRRRLPQTDPLISKPHACCVNFPLFSQTLTTIVCHSPQLVGARAHSVHVAVAPEGFLTQADP